MWIQEASKLLDKNVKALKRMLWGSFDKHWRSGWYMLRYCSLDRMVEGIPKFRTLPDFYDSLYELVMCSSIILIEGLHKRNRQK